jgi:hypothetical protein
MAYYLKFDGVDDKVTMSTVSRTDTSWEIEFKTLEVGKVNNGTVKVLNSSGNNDYVAYLGNALKTVLYYRLDGTSYDFEFTGFDIFDDAPHVYKFIYDGTTLSADIDGTAADATQTVGGLTFKDFNQFGGVTPDINIGLYYFKYWDDDARTTQVYFWNPTTSGGTGSTLTDDTSTNNGTLVNFPGDDTEWVFYSDGGTLSIAGATTNYSYSAVNGAVDLTGTLSITAQTKNYNYSAVAGSVDLISEIAVTGTTPSYQYTAVLANVELVGTLSVSGATPNYNYQSVGATVQLQGAINVVGTTSNYSYSAIPGNVSIVQALIARKQIKIPPSNRTNKITVSRY